MKDFLSSATLFLAWFVGLVAAASWGYFIWGFDWGTSSRARGLWGMIFGFGSILAFLVGVFLIVGIHMWLFPEEGKR